MMNKEAIEILRKHDSWPLWSVEAHAAIDMAISALRKQEGKKVIVTTSTKRCPSCNKQVSGRGNIHPNYKYCRFCGQRIDWSDEHGTD